MKTSKYLLAVAIATMFMSEGYSQKQYVIEKNVPSSRLQQLIADPAVENITIDQTTVSEENCVALNNLIREKAKRLHIDIFSDLGEVSAGFLGDLLVHSASNVSVNFNCAKTDALVKFLQNNSSNVNVIQLLLSANVNHEDLQKIARALIGYRNINLIGDSRTGDSRTLYVALKVRHDNAVKLQQMLEEEGKSANVIDRDRMRQLINGKWLPMDEKFSAIFRQIDETKVISGSRTSIPEMESPMVPMSKRKAQMPMSRMAPVLSTPEIESPTTPMSKMKAQMPMSRMAPVLSTPEIESPTTPMSKMKTRMPERFPALSDHVMSDFAGRLLTEYPVVSFLKSEKEEEAYKTTWDPRLTLAENRERLLSRFLDTCCDFSFKVKEDSKIGGYIQGHIDSGEDIVVLRNGITKYPAGHKNTAILARIQCEEIRTLDEHLKAQLVNCFTDISRNPIGCELMRVLIAKSVAGGKSKLIFLPVKASGHAARRSDFAFGRFMNIEDTVIRDFFGKEELKIPVKTYDFMICPIDVTAISETDQFMNFDKGDFLLHENVIPLDGALLHEAIHSLQPENMRTTSVIEERYPSSEPLWKQTLSDDTEYECMFGLGNKSFHILSEAAYMATKYDRMRIAHNPIILDGQEDGAQSGRKFALVVFTSLIRKDGDFGLYQLYLDPNSPIRKQFPRFGIGQYQCSDLDPETGEEIGEIRSKEEYVKETT